ncbi:MAG: hypothetical protein Q4E06_02710 [Lautropia sp.]|nr:hypothetical protein [Lautropia sp.]
MPNNIDDIRPCGPVSQPARPALHGPDLDRLTRQAPASRLGTRLLSGAVLMLGLAACGSGESPDNSSASSAHSTDKPIAALAHGLDDSLALPAHPHTDSTTSGPEAEDEAVHAHQRVLRAVPSPVSADVCNGVLAHNHALPAGIENARIPGVARPAIGTAITDPTYRSCVARVTDNTSAAPYHRNDYSRRQAFNANSTFMLMSARDGHWFLYDARTLKPIKRLNGLAGDAEPQWHYLDPNRLYYLNRNGVGMQIHLLDVRSNRSRLVADMSAQVRKRWPGANAAWTRSEGSPSFDQRYWCFQAENTHNWSTHGVFTWDMKEQRIVGGIDVQERPDHVSMSPSGHYCVVSSDGRMGTRSYTRDFKTPYFPGRGSQPWLQLHHKSEHSDIALDKNQVDAYVAVDYQAGEVFSTNLRNGRKFSLFPVYPGRTATALHISGKAYRKPGWVLVSTYAEYHADNMRAPVRNTAHQQWLHRKMFAVSLEARPRFRPIAHVDSTLASAPGIDAYWTEPHATVNPDFTRMLFNSTWNSSNAHDVETYLTALPAGALDR